MTIKQARVERRLHKANERRRRDTAFDPATGKLITGPALGRIRNNRATQAQTIDKKRSQRRAFAKKSPWQRQTAREAGCLKQGLPTDRAARLLILRQREKTSANAGIA